jgi:hypothetical protein
MSALADSARQFIGTRFRHRGRGAKSVDCVGLVWCAYNALGVALPDYQLYAKEPHRDSLVMRAQEALGPPVAGRPMDGDVVLIRNKTVPYHVAVIGEKVYDRKPQLTLIHAEGVHGSVIEVRLTPDVKITHVFRRPV